MRMRKKKNLVPRMERCSRVWIRDPEEYKGKWRSLMPGCAELRLELGCGKGRFTCETAALHPDKLFVAVERVPDAMVTAMERAMSMGLTNVFFIDGDAAVLSSYFAPDEVDLIYINFCDPWPGNKHVRRRLTHCEMLRHYRDVLRDGGEIHFKTDNRNLYEWSLFQFPKAGYSLSEISRNLHRDGIQGIMTDYEEKFHLQGVPINRCVAAKGELPQRSLESELRDRLPRWEVRPLSGEDADAAAGLLGLKEIPDVGTLCRTAAPLPPRAREEQRRDLGLWLDGTLVCLLSCVEDCPGDGFLWLSRLQVAEDGRRTGIGRTVVSALKEGAAEMDWKELRLSCPPEEESYPFWTALGFRPRPDREGDWQHSVLSWKAAGGEEDTDCPQEG